MPLAMPAPALSADALPADALSALAPSAVEYPCSDGRPMAESTVHQKATVAAHTALKGHFEPAGRGFVASDLLIYHVEGDPSRSVAPDVFVALGVSAHERESYLLWQEPKMPDFVLELTSPSTRNEDRGHKRELYASLGVEEYWLFDPRGEWLAPPLQGFELHGGEYRPIPSVATVDKGLLLSSPVLGLKVWLEAGKLRFQDPDTGEYLRGPEEEAAARKEEAAARKEEAAAREAAEARAEEEAAAREEEAAAREAAEARAEEEAAARKEETAAREAAEARVEEEAAAREAAEARAEEEAAVREEEAAARKAAEARAEEEAAAREAAEARVEEEVAAREALEARLAELEARFERPG